ncbi:MAG: hypothetical protein PHT96_11840 [Syntrophorhabdaceae bacterium]|nr:hypothetical protein [Syntrophorhabdaceae bacterium]MDD4197076.1 hypothetical protein [Syntrophorhabdaceae bacterium]
MNCKRFTNRIDRLGRNLTGKGHGLSTIIQEAGESDEDVQRRADRLKEQRSRQFGRSGSIVIVTSYFGKGAKNDTE